MKPNLTIHNTLIFTLMDPKLEMKLLKLLFANIICNKWEVYQTNQQFSLLNLRLLALDYIATWKHYKYIIFSNSMSCLKSITNIKLSIPLISQIVENITYQNLEYIVMCWLPGHVGIKGNEMTESSLQLPVSSNKIHHSDLRYYNLKL